jgi:hypothetical protein
MIDIADTLTQSLDVMSDSPLWRRFVTDTRVYTVFLSRDLFGTWVLCQAWGSRVSERGGGKSTVVPNVAAGLAVIEVITRRRQQRGYRLLG